ncbi:Granule-bound starch synthase 1, chloroplastic/amyloplastic [Ananas comosus]|uniref:NDP-glucose--starch glucosyltransferase n=1 Tax=Ananas comosus TaxID=4615 RepID=A0A199UUM6_ANACO|nr:Granule-bound starch synthase 1, chloroplastic/amyloplastic [Ananas comosus]
MATMTASQLISKHAAAKHCGATDSKPRLFQKKITADLKKQAGTAYHGLRSQNKIDLLQMRAIAKPNTKQAATKRDGGASTRPWAVVICGKGMNLVFVGAEMAPWSKTGGLGDVLGGLPPAMAANGHRVMTIAPRYDQYADAWDTNALAQVKVGNSYETVRFFHCYKRGVDRVFIDHPMFLAKVWGKTGSKIYGPTTGIDYQDNQLRFSLFCQAALEAPRVLFLNNSQFYAGPYGEDVVFIANDWHTAALPCYLKSMYKPHGIYRSAKVAFCIHNIVYQGRFAASDFSLLNLPDYFKPSFNFIDGYNKPVKGRKINWMQAGILESDRVLTVSPYYAQELVSGEQRGVELDDTLRRSGVTGIVNGMDVNEWNPSTDKYISVNYDASTVRIGTGKKKFEKQLESIEETFPQKVRAVMKFNAPLAHQMMAGADIVVVPSRFEPCGLIQLQAMQYGTPPACASTGGLVDTVKEGKTGFHMGLLSADCEAVDPADVKKVVGTVKRAVKVVGTGAFKEMIHNCMAQDLSWKGPAKQWESFLLSLNVAGSEPGVTGEEIAPLAAENIAAP